MYKPILCHIKVGINLHGGPDAGMTDRLGDCCQIKIRIIFVLDVILGHIGMAEAMYSIAIFVLAQSHITANIIRAPKR